jgi:hypothetical protein
MASPIPNRGTIGAGEEDEALDQLSSSSSSSTGSETGVSLAEKASDQDGHRPSLAEITAPPRTRSSVALPPSDAAAVATAADISRVTSRREALVSRVRSRPVPRFSHPREHFRTGPEHIVDFDGPRDPYYPLNWSVRRKVLTTMLYGFVTMTATWASASFSAGTRQVAHEFHVGLQTATLGTSLYLMGFGIGPLLWAPLSEVYGRRLAVLVPMFVSMCLTFGSATAKDLQTVMLTRFFGAFFASAPVTNTGGVLGDIYPASQRAIAIAGYAMAVVGGPALGMCLLTISRNSTPTYTYPRASEVYFASDLTSSHC